MNRRDIAKALTGAAALLCLPACEQRSSPPPKLPPFSASRFQSRLEALRLAYEAKKQHVSNTLQAGLSEGELRERCAWFPSRLPDELVALYGWHDGQPSSPGEEEYPFLFRDCGFTCIRNAEREYRAIMSSYGTQPRLHEFLKHSFPFAAFDAGWLVLPCKDKHPDSPYEHAVVSVFQDVMLMFYSMETMVETCIGWASDQGTPFWFPFGGMSDDAVLERFNPGILALQKHGSW
jgi:hypothetical protein